MSAAVEEQTATLAEVTRMVDGLKNMAALLQEQVGKFNTGSSRGNSRQNMEIFKNAHVKWVERVETMLQGGTAIARKDLVTHTDCAFGKWYLVRGKVDFGHLSEFKAIDSPHARLHELAREAVEAMEQGDRVTAERSLKEMRRASEKVVSGLDRLSSGSDLRAAA